MVAKFPLPFPRNIPTLSVPELATKIFKKPSLSISATVIDNGSEYCSVEYVVMFPNVPSSCPR
ncbi:unnamed protein product, partial [Rotaria magnacalcarata]